MTMKLALWLQAKRRNNHRKCKKGAIKALEVSKQHNCNFMLFDIRECREAQPIVQGYYICRIWKNNRISKFHKCAIVYDRLNTPGRGAVY
jgi:hypothetical protein